MSITLIIIVFTIAVSLYASENLEVKRKLIFNPYQVLNHKQYYRALTHAFIHADLMHLGINMFVLYFFGRNVEYYFQVQFPEMAKTYFILLYVGGIIFATFPALYKHKDNPGYNSLGASGAVSAVLFSAIILDPTNTIYIYAFLPMPAILFGVLYIGYEMYMDKNGRTNIAHDAHIIGAVFGIIFTILLSPSNVISNFIQSISTII